MSRSDCWRTGQGKKGKGQTKEATVGLTEAFLASQPAGGEDGEGESLWREIQATSVLLADFVGGTHLWEALEVWSMRTASVAVPVRCSVFPMLCHE